MSAGAWQRFSLTTDPKPWPGAVRGLVMAILCTRIRVCDESHTIDDAHTADRACLLLEFGREIRNRQWPGCRRGRIQTSITPYLEQKLALFTSPWVTTGRLGVEALWRRSFSAEVQSNILWAMGNAFALQLSLGLQREGFYQPAVRITGSMLFGDRIEMLYDDGRRPARPSWAIGPRLVPLRFGVDRGFASVLEAGLGTDLQGGRLVEITLLKAGARW